MQSVLTARPTVLVLTLALAALSPHATPAFALSGFCGGTTPCECGDKLVASRNLVHNLDPITRTVCTGDGLIVDGSSPPNITLNLGSQTIRGSGSGISAGIRIVDSYSGLTVTGGQIIGFGSGVRHGTAGAPVTGKVNSSTFSFLRLYANIGEGIVLRGDDNTIEANEAARMVCGVVGISIDGDRNRVTFNRVQFNGLGDGQVAFHVGSGDTADPSTVSRNVARQNTQCGVAPPIGFEIGSALVELNRSEDNDGQGFFIDDNSTVVRNIAIRNGGGSPDPELKGRLGSGFVIRGTSNVHLELNRADYNKGFGIWDLNAGPANTYKRNVCSGPPTVLDGTGMLAGGGAATIAISGESAVSRLFNDPTVCVVSNPCGLPVLASLCL
jgi:hypothetical protein